MTIGLGVLGLSPSVFWNEFTLPELMAAIDGYQEANGGRDDEEAGALTAEDREDIRAMMKEHDTPDGAEQRKKTLALVKQLAAEKMKREGKKLPAVLKRAS